MNDELLEQADAARDYLEHHGILGQKWGVRRYQNKDGSLTKKGKARLAKLEAKAQEDAIRTMKKSYRKMSDEELVKETQHLKNQVNYINAINEYKKATYVAPKKSIISKLGKFGLEMATPVLKEQGKKVLDQYLDDTLKSAGLLKTKQKTSNEAAKEAADYWRNVANIVTNMNTAQKNNNGNVNVDYTWTDPKVARRQKIEKAKAAAEEAAKEAARQRQYQADIEEAVRKMYGGK